MSYLWICGFAVFMVAPSNIWAESIMLKDGDHIEGEVLSVENDFLKVKSKYGEISVPKGDLADSVTERYFPKIVAKSMSFKSAANEENVEYTYYIDGKQIAAVTRSLAGEMLSSTGSIKDGLYKEFYENGGLKKEQTIINGAQNGPMRIYYPTGKLQSETYYVNGYKHGPCKVYDDSGNIIAETTFRQGEIVKADKASGSDNYKQNESPALLDPKPATSKTNARIYAALEAFSISGGDSKWKDNTEAWADYAVNVLGYDSASYTVDPAPGVGGKVGVLVPFKNSPDAYWGASLGYVKGPSADIDVTARTTLTTWGYYSGTMNTSFIRALFEMRKVYALSNKNRFSIGIAAGLAQGKIELEENYSGSFVTVLGAPSIVSSDDTWSGFTWELTPSVLIPSGSSEFEFGARIAGFPKCTETDSFSEFKWQPFVVFIGVNF